MKRIVYLILLLPVIVFAGVGNKSKDDVRREFVKACVDDGADQMPSEQTKAIFRDYCVCAGEKVMENFTIAELEEINRIGKNERKDSYELKLIQAKLIKVIKPCLDELQARALTALTPDSKIGPRQH